MCSEILQSKRHIPQGDLMARRTSAGLPNLKNESFMPPINVVEDVHNFLDCSYQ